MSDPQTSATTSQAPSEPAASTTPTESLEQIAREINVDDQAANFQATPPSMPTAPMNYGYQPQASAPMNFQPTIPDPVVDAEGYRAYMLQQTSVQGQLRGSLQSLEQRLARYEEHVAQERVRTEINKAVSTVNEKLKVDPLMAEVALEVMHREDPNFARIWDNRQKNPKALERALAVVADKLAPRFSMRQDPQLIENQRAMTTSQRTMASTHRADFDPRYRALYEPESQADFDQAWESFKRGMGPG
jgi:hypothetical protein